MRQDEIGDGAGPRLIAKKYLARPPKRRSAKLGVNSAGRIADHGAAIVSLNATLGVAAPDIPADGAMASMNSFSTVAPSAIDSIVALHRLRVRTNRFAMSMRQQMLATIRSTIGLASGAVIDDADVKKKSLACVQKIVRRKPTDFDGVLKPVMPLLEIARDAVAQLESYRDNLDAERDKLCEALPIWSKLPKWKGFGVGSMATIIGECGDLSKYPHWRMLWKRCGWACIDGKPQGKPGANATADDWIRHGCNKQRRSAIWMATAQCQRLNGDAFWRSILNERKALELAKLGLDAGEKGCGQADKRALGHVVRGMLKAVWQAWNGREISLSSRWPRE